MLFTLLFADNNMSIKTKRKKNLRKYPKKIKNNTEETNIIKEFEWGGAENLINWPL